MLRLCCSPEPRGFVVSKGEKRGREMYGDVAWRRRAPYRASRRAAAG